MLPNACIAVFDISSSQSTWVHCWDVPAQVGCKLKANPYTHTFETNFVTLQIEGLVINSVARGTHSIRDNSAWSIPFGLFYVVPTIVASLIWFVPEVRLSIMILCRTIHTDKPYQTHSRLVGWP